MAVKKMDKSLLRTFLLINFYALKEFWGQAHGFKIFYFFISNRNR